MSGVENYNKLLIKFSSNNSNYLGRQFGDKKNLYRSFYQRDRDRIIHSTSFRRLKYKTQVFVYDEGDHYRTRLTHTLEVSQISRSISRYLKLNEDLSEAISLAHDLGHPPFGHAGEKILDYCIRNHGGFNHNIHSIRLVTELEKAYQNFDGLNLSINTIDGIVKHNGPNYLIKQNLDLLPNLNKIKKINFYNQSSLEAQISALSDDIAYNNHDIDDGIRAGLFSINDIKDLPIIGEIIKKKNKQFKNKKLLRNEIIRSIINFMVTDLILHTKKNLKKYKIKTIDDVYNSKKFIVSFSPKLIKANNQIREFLKLNMYENKSVKEMTDKAEKILPITDIKSARQALKPIQEEWSKIGHVPRKDKEKIESRLKSVEEAIRNAEKNELNRTDPAKSARAQSTMELLEAKLIKTEKERDAALVKGDTKKAESLSATIESQKMLLEATKVT
ncbi:MAG: dNTP triphosphohydrolase, partial [Candidatus Fonsibacter ubiquis]|nr:dNTP triphosphohydrolase [Candidatus Fonsibacter ubiquis]